ncbi:MAG TPA: hypothetical protein VHA33_13485 [Candidatus Angelobacter sp.]|nr:hypothetical protein [Candidatus Angelobacter sp.]
MTSTTLDVTAREFAKSFEYQIQIAHQCGKGMPKNICAKVIALAAIVSFLSLHAAHAQNQPVGIVPPLSSSQTSQPPKPQAGAVTTGNGIEYHGGPVMLGPHNVYFIWYGGWSGDTATTILPDFINGLNGSPYFNTNTTYGDNTGDIANTISVAGQFFDNYSQGSSLGSSGVFNVLSSALNSGSLPTDPNGIYLVLTSPDVTEGSFCNTYCGYHTRTTLNGTDIKYGLVGNPATQCNANHAGPRCSIQAVTPNANEGADAMASVITHEVNETITDSDLTAWFQSNLGGEVGDLCNFNFGRMFFTPNGAFANVTLGAKNYLIQQNWVNDSGGFCAFIFNQQSKMSLNFVPVTPCRVADTRNANGPFGGPILSGNTTRGFAIPASACNIPSNAVAFSLNFTVVPPGKLSYLTAFPCGEPQPLVSTLNSDGRIKAVAGIVPGRTTDGSVCVYVTEDTHLVLDIDGYFVPSSNTGSMAFFPVTPCRVVDTRQPAGPLGGPTLAGNSTRTFPILSSPCNVPATAQAYSLNYTAVPRAPQLSFLTTWPAGQSQPLVSTLNASTGAITANAAIVPAGTNGDVNVFVSENADLVIDINGYFAPPATGGLSFHTLSPCRVLDTRQFTGAQPFVGQFDTYVFGTGCAAPPIAQAYVLNATVVPQQPLDYLTLWQPETSRPLVSTLNASDGAITSNMAIVPIQNGTVSAYAPQSTHMVLDIFGYFAP